MNVEYTLVKISVADINYVEGLKDYIKIHLASADKPVITRMSQKTIKEKLPPTFIRTHRSFLVATPKITVIKRDFVCIGKREIPLSDSCRENITALLNRPTGPVAWFFRVISTIIRFVYSPRRPMGATPSFVPIPHHAMRSYPRKSYLTLNALPGLLPLPPGVGIARR